MSVMRVPSTPAEPVVPTLRVREMARQAVVRMAFSACVSVALAICLLLLAYGAGR